MAFLVHSHGSPWVGLAENIPIQTPSEYMKNFLQQDQWINQFHLKRGRHFQVQLALRLPLEWVMPLHGIKVWLKKTDSNTGENCSALCRATSVTSLVLVLADLPSGGWNNTWRLNDAVRFKNVYDIYQITEESFHVKVKPLNWGFLPIQ